MGSFDFVREDPRIILSYVILQKPYEELNEDATGFETASAFLATLLREYVPADAYANEHHVSYEYEKYYSGHRRTVQIMKLIRKLAVSEVLPIELGTESRGIIFGVVRIFVEYLNAHNIGDILHLLQKPKVREQVDLMIAAWEKAELDGISDMAYSYSFIPFITDELINVDFMCFVAKNKNEFRKEALDMSRKSGLTVSNCLYLIMNKEYKRFVSECDGTYDT